MDAQLRPRRQLRRSKRLVLSVRVRVFGHNVFQESFNEFTSTLSVSADGAAIALAAKVDKGRKILVVNQSTGVERECRVVYVGSVKDGKTPVGIEFVDPVANFWKINFPTCVPGPKK